MKLETIKEYIVHLEFLGYSVEALEQVQEEEYKSVLMKSPVYGEKLLTTPL